MQSENFELESHGADPARGTTRRTVVVGAAWSMPVIAAAIAAPMAAASTVTAADLQVVRVTYPTATQVGTNRGEPMYADNQLLHSTVTYTNAGPGTVPAGTLITFTVAESAGAQFDVPSISTHPTGVVLGPPTMSGETVSFEVLTPILPGQSFDIEYQITTTQLPGGRYQGGFSSAIQHSAITDSAPTNNTGFSGSFWIEGTGSGAPANLAVTEVTVPAWAQVDTTADGTPIYADSQYTQFRVVYTNTGSMTFPAGVTITGFAHYPEGVFQPIGLVGASTPDLTAWTTGPNISTNSTVQAKTTTPMAPGASITITYQLQGLDVGGGRYPSNYGGRIDPVGIVENNPTDNNKQFTFTIAGT